MRTDVLGVLKELQVPLVRYPGGQVFLLSMVDAYLPSFVHRNFVSSYRWQDGVGPKELRPRRPELAWLTEESNQFGTDEFVVFCEKLGAEPFMCFNMGTGTLEDALAWVEYCNRYVIILPFSIPDQLNNPLFIARLIRTMLT